MDRPNIILVQTPCLEIENDRLEPPLGLLYLATWLRSNGYDAQIIDLSSVPGSNWLAYIPPASIYGFSTYTATYHMTKEIARLVKGAYPWSHTVAGGPHATALPNVVAQDLHFVIVGEGENGILRLVRAIETGQALPRIIVEPEVDNLDTLPFPDYSLVDVSSYSRLVGNRPSLSILSSRGCPYSCVFCNSNIMGAHRRPRYRSVTHVVNEIQTIKRQYGITAFRFQDDIFTLDLNRLRNLTEMLRTEDIIYRCFGRVDRCSREMTDLLYEGGCRHIAFGVESGAADMLKRMKKGQTVDDIRAGIANARASGLIVRVYLMVGFPGETWETIEATVNLMLECAPHEFAVYPLIPYPGTLIYDNPVAFGIQSINPDFSQYFQVKRNRDTGYVFRSRDLDEATIEEMRRYVIRRLEPAITWAGDSGAFK